MCLTGRESPRERNRQRETRTGAGRGAAQCHKGDLTKAPAMGGREELGKFSRDEVPILDEDHAWRRDEMTHGGDVRGTVGQLDPPPSRMRVSSFPVTCKYRDARNDPGSPVY